MGSHCQMRFHTYKLKGLYRPSSVQKLAHIIIDLLYFRVQRNKKNDTVHLKKISSGDFITGEFNFFSVFIYTHTYTYFAIIVHDALQGFRSNVLYRYHPEIIRHNKQLFYWFINCISGSCFLEIKVVYKRNEKMRHCKRIFNAKVISTKITS